VWYSEQLVIFAPSDFPRDRGMNVLRVLDTLGSGNTYLSWLILWASLWTLIYIMSLLPTPEANPFEKGY
jgi:hypothetical protein